MINITTTTGGCGYVFVSWSVINNVPDDDMCAISRVIITFSPVDVSITVMTGMISYNFTGLPDDALFNVTVIGATINEGNVNSASISVKTMTIKSMCVYKVVDIHSYNYIIANVCEYLKELTAHVCTCYQKDVSKC